MKSKAMMVAGAALCAAFTIATLAVECAADTDCTLRYHLAATPAQAELLSTTSNAGRERTATSKWFSIAPEALKSVMELRDELALRSAAGGDEEILLILPGNTVEKKHARHVLDSLDRYGRPSALVVLTDEASDILGRFTESNRGRFVAICLNERVVCVHRIVQRVSSQFAITNISASEFSNAWGRPYSKADTEGAILVTPWRVVVAAVIVVILVLACLPTRKASVSPHPGRWLIAGAAVGMLIGAIGAGLLLQAVATASAPDDKMVLPGPDGETHPVGYVVIDVPVTINMPWLAMGALIGVMAGAGGQYIFRRAAFNALRLFKRQRRSENTE